MTQKKSAKPSLSLSCERQIKEKCGNRIIKVILQQIKTKPGIIYADSQKNIYGSCISPQITELSPGKLNPKSNTSSNLRREVGSSSSDKGNSYDAENKAESNETSPRRSLRQSQRPTRNHNTSFSYTSESDDSDVQEIRPSKSKCKSKQKIEKLSQTKRTTIAAKDKREKKREYLRRRKKFVHKCELCSEKFKSVTYLEHHILRFHVMDKPFECEICFKSFLTQKNLSNHVERCHKATDDLVSVYQCQHCKTSSGSKTMYRAFSSKDELRFHLDAMHSNLINNSDSNNYFCPICQVTFQSDSDFQAHLKKNENIVIKCSLCFLEMDTQCLLTDHRWKKHACFDSNDTNENQKQDSTRQNKNSSTSTGDETKIEFKCLVCESIFTRRSDLRLHEIAKKHRRWKCPLCSKLLVSNKGLTDHIRSVHSDSRPFKCKRCDKGYKTSNDLKKHAIVHPEDRKLHNACKDCDKVFSDKKNLVRHVANHHGGEKNFKCDKCPKTFGARADLRQHLIYSHSDLRPFICSFCGAGYKKNADRNRHMKQRCFVRKAGISRGHVKEEVVESNCNVEENSSVEVKLENDSLHETVTHDIKEEQQEEKIIVVEDPILIKKEET